MRSRIFIQWIAAVTLLGTARGDIIYLKNGNELEGTVLEQNDFLIKFKTGVATVEFDMAEVKEIHKGKTFLDVYRQMWILADHEDAKAKLELANWAKRHKLMKEAELELRQVLLIDPNNRTARMQLGFVKMNGKWVTRDEANLSKGLVRYKGKWMTPQDREKKRDSSLRNQTRDRINAIFKKMARAKPFEQEKLIQELLKIKNSYAAPVIVRYVVNPHDHVREAATQVLGSLRDASVIPALADLSLEDDSGMVRRQAALAMKAIGKVVALNRLIPHLTRNRQRSRRYRAAQALGEIGDPRVIPHLIEALVIKIRIVSGLNPFQRPGQMAAENTNKVAGQNSVITKFTGEKVVKTSISKGLTAGAKSNVQEEFEENAAALEALKRLTGKNFDYSKPKWRTWWSTHEHEVLRNARKK
ncbi:MAG: HEAT repeat domain-containing protein [Planctomycetota bacterium]|nr:HEAT repeat domain-containing protein [Planctomycetota bacterium]